jgi:hypothetical protein
MLQLEETNHSYYCSDTNYYVGNHNGENYGRCDYDTWRDFIEEWGSYDNDLNHVFRFDILPKTDEDGEDIEGEYSLMIFYILQRKGIFRPIWIKNIEQSDMEEITIFLTDKWEYIKNQWHELTTHQPNSKKENEK